MPADTASRQPSGAIVRLVRTVLGPIASLKITVALFLLSSLLVFFGTLAQKGQGVWTVVDNYFYSWWVKVELQYLLEFGKVFFGFAPDSTTSAWVPFPAGKTLGWLMVVNLAAAHILQFVSLVDGVRKQTQRSRSTAADVLLLMAKRSGIFILHGGVLLLLVGEYVTREYAVEQQMMIPEGGSSNYAYETRNFEIAFNDPSNPEYDRVSVLPASKLKAAVEARDRATQYNLPQPSTKFTHPDLPVDVEVLAYYPNSELIDVTRTLSDAIAATFPDPAAAAKVFEGYDKLRKASPEGDPLAQLETVLTPLGGESGMEPAAVAKLQTEIDRLKGMQQATAGAGLRYIAQSRPEVSGVDTTQQSDSPAAYVNLYAKEGGDSLGIYLVSMELKPQAIPGRTETFDLRPTRHYKDYTLYLKDFKFDRYIGTSTAKNYSSDIRLVDPGLNQDRDVTIRMNEPLRHRGDAIFQSSFTPDEKATILQVVSNPGWTIPYISCVLVMIGMTLHFCIKMGQFVSRAMTGKKSPTPASKPTAATPAGAIDLRTAGQTPFQRFGVPAIAAALALLVLVGMGYPRKPKKDSLDLQQLATLPVVEGGRVKPLDTVARVALRQITHREEATDDGDKKRSAIQWFMDTAVSSPERKDGPSAWPIFRIENEEVRDLFKLPKKEGLRYSINELRDGFQEFDTAAKKAAQVDEKSRTLFEQKVLELRRHVEMYLQVAFGDMPLLLPPGDDLEWRKLADAERKVQAEAMPMALPRIRERMAAKGMPADPQQLNEQQQREAAGIITEELDRVTGELDPPLAAWTKVLDAYRAGDPVEFDSAVSKYRKLVTERVPADQLKRVQLETFLNQSSLYYWCTGLYAVAGLGSLIGFVLLLVAPKGSQTIRRGVFWWLVVTFVAHTITLFARMYLMDRPLVFVTNLYSSAVFIGWGVVALCLILEMIYPIGFGNLVASVLGLTTTIIAHNLAASGDTLEMMQAVLDTNFWLATHVTTVTLGYSATYAAGVLGLIYVALYVLPEKAVLRQRVTIGSDVHTLTYDIGKILGTLTYAVVCFATLLSFVGTVLGGIWADQSWGRFWGWDPKENGAVLIVLWNALILHARWGGLVKERGMAVLTVVGIIITTWSWFGTNQLGVGLHAYGFNNQLVRLCDGVWLASLAAVLVGVLPWQWVYRGGEPAPPPLATRV